MGADPRTVQRQCLPGIVYGGSLKLLCLLMANGLVLKPRDVDMLLARSRRDGVGRMISFFEAFKADPVGIAAICADGLDQESAYSAYDNYFVSA